MFSWLRREGEERENEWIDYDSFIIYNLKEREVPNVDSTVDTENVIPLVFT